MIMIDIKMPNSCSCCPCFDSETNCCNVKIIADDFDIFVEHPSERKEDCPLRDAADTEIPSMTYGLLISILEHKKKCEEKIISELVNNTDKDLDGYFAYHEGLRDALNSEIFALKRIQKKELNHGRE